MSDDAAAIFKSWWRSHTEEDASRLMQKILKRSSRKMDYMQGQACKKGNHGFYMRHAGFSGGRIYWRCDNCGAGGSNIDEPMTI